MNIQSDSVLQPSEHIDYSGITASYDIINNIFSFGLIKKWRAHLASFLYNKGPLKVLDAACGTGEQIVSFYKAKLNLSSINGIDTSSDMIQFAKKKIRNNNLIRRVFLECGDACNLRFQNDFFDTLSLTFSLRDILDIGKLFNEAHRVLKFDCPVLLLDFNKPQYCNIPLIYTLYFKFIYATSGEILSGSHVFYKHLKKTLSNLPDHTLLIKQLRDAGFHKISYYSLCGGIAFIVTAKKRL